MSEKFEELCEFLECVPMTIVSGLFLITSFIFERVGLDLPVDPAWVSVLVSGTPIVHEAIEQLIENKGISKITSALLISIAMIAAILIGDLFAAGEVAFIMAIGEILEGATTERAKRGLHKLISLTPTQGRLVLGREEKMVPAQDIKVDDIIRILPGEAIPVDGVIIAGQSSIDQAIMTGESLPVDKSINDEVYCGTINRFGTIDIRATKVGEDSSLQKMIRLVQEAEEKKAPMARIADKAASWLVPLAMCIAIITGIVTQNIARAVTVLVVFCPCALVLATPTAIMAAIGQATKHGVIVKSGEALEKLGKVDIIAFDKTGTLTYGKLQVSDVVTFTESEEDILKFAACVESRSEHPLGQAIVAFAKEKGLAIDEVSGFEMTAGRGVKANVNGSLVICGNEGFLSENGISISDGDNEKLLGLMAEGKAMILVAKDGQLIGAIALSDTIRPEASEMIGKLRELNTDVVLLTGDNEKTAKYFASKVGIESVKARLIPGEKMANIQELKDGGKVVCMIGDGVNDAPALKASDVGVAMGTMGSDIAVEAADVALMSDDLSRLPYLKKLSDLTVKTIRFGITLSMTINVIAVALSVMGILNPTTGALVHNAGSCLVVLIAALLYDRKI